jgi:hypothetical protein
MEATIQEVRARQIFDLCGNPAVEADSRHHFLLTTRKGS